MRVLFATTLIPANESSGGEVVSQAVIRGLEELGCELTVLGYLRPGEQADLSRTVVVDRRPIETTTSGFRAAIWLLRSLISRRPYTSIKFLSRRYARLARQLAETNRIDVVLLDHTQMGWLLDWLPTSTPVWVLMHNAESDFYARGAGEMATSARIVYRRESRLLARLEKRIAFRAEKIWVLSDADADTIGSLTGAAGVAVLPVLPESRRGPRSKADAVFDVGLLATWSWRPNAEALRWFLAEVYPLLPAGTSIHVAGRGAQWLDGRYPGVTYRGFVEDAADFLASGKVVAAATHHGGGVETKMLLAIVAGCRIVATSASVRGLGPLPSSVLVADRPDAFARMLIETMQTPAHPPDLAQAESWRRARRRAFASVLSRELACVGPKAAESAPQICRPGRAALSGASA